MHLVVGDLLLLRELLPKSTSLGHGVFMSYALVFLKPGDGLKGEE